jgi:hypothetical protein
MLVIATCATRSYLYAIKSLTRRVIANLSMANIKESVFVVAHDGSSTALDALRWMAGKLPKGHDVIGIVNEEWAESDNYTVSAQMLIARMRAACV